jgi:hypothetical protein
MKAIFWDVVQCGFIVNRCFGWTSHLHLQGRRNNPSRKRVRQLLRLFILPWRWRRHIPLKHRFIINPHGATFQKEAFFLNVILHCSHQLLNEIIYLRVYLLKPHLLLWIPLLWHGHCVCWFGLSYELLSIHLVLNHCSGSVHKWYMVHEVAHGKVPLHILPWTKSKNRNQHWHTTVYL